MGRLKLASLLFVAFWLAVAVAWQAPKKSYIVITAQTGSGKAEYYDAKGRHEHPFLHQAISELALNGYRVVECEMSGFGDQRLSVTIMEK